MMAAIRSDWILMVIHKGRSTLAFSLLIFFLAGFPHEGSSAIPPIKPTPTPSAQECRHHVEKALDQYFEEKPENQIKAKYGIPTRTPVHSPDKTSDGDDNKLKSPTTTTTTTAASDKTQSDSVDKKTTETKIKHIPSVKTADKVTAEKPKPKDIKKDDDTIKKVIEKPQDSKEAKTKNESTKSDSSIKVSKDKHDKERLQKSILSEQNLKVDANLAEHDEHEHDQDIDNDGNVDNNFRNIVVNGDDNEDTANENNIPNKDNISKPAERRHPNIPKIRPRESVSTKTRSNEEKEAKKEVKDESSSYKEGTDTGSEVDDDDDDDDDEKDDEDTPGMRIAKLHPIQFTSSSGKVSHREKDTGGPDIVASRVVQEFPRSKSPPEQPKTKEIPKKTQTVIKRATEGTNQTQRLNKTIKITTEHEVNDEDDHVVAKEKDDDEDVENIYEEEDEINYSGLTFRSRDHIDAILNLDNIGTGYDQEEDKLAQSIFRDIKKIHATNIKPMEVLYKFSDSSSRSLGDAEIFNKPMILFLGPWNTGKTSVINYLLGIERTPAAFKTGTGITDVDFTVITHGDKRKTISGTELTVDWRYANLQKFGQGFLDHFKAVTMPHTLLKKINIVDTPGILENRKNLARGYPFNEAFQWFIDRADAIYVVLDPTKVDVGAEMGTIVDQLKGREVRFILNKADTIRRSDLMRVVGQLFWNLSPLMGSTEAPVIYAVSLSSKPFNPTAPAKFLADQENNFLFDLKDIVEKRVENRILYARRHAVRVRNHAKMVDCYLATYYRHKSIFSNKKNIAKMIVDNPSEYRIYEGLGNISNVSRYDILDTSAYKNFFQLHPLYDFRPLVSTCSYFRGCPMDKLDIAISAELPELLAKYKKSKDITSTNVKKDGR